MLTLGSLHSVAACRAGGCCAARAPTRGVACWDWWLAATGCSSQQGGGVGGHVVSEKHSTDGSIYGCSPACVTNNESTELPMSDCPAC